MWRLKSSFMRESPPFFSSLPQPALFFHSLDLCRKSRAYPLFTFTTLCNEGCITGSGRDEINVPLVNPDSVPRGRSPMIIYIYSFIYIYIYLGKKLGKIQVLVLE